MVSIIVNSIIGVLGVDLILEIKFHYLVKNWPGIKI